MLALLITALSLAIGAVFLWRRAVAARKIAVTQMMHVESAFQAARSANKLLDAGLDGARDGLIIFDQHGRQIACNSAVDQIVKLAASADLGVNVEQLVVWPRLKDALELCLRKGEGQSFDYDVEEAVGADRRLRFGLLALPGMGAIVVIEDVSRVKRLESLRRDFVANVSHELKTPLAAIKGFVETMQDDPQMPSETRVRFLGRVSQQSERLATLVTDLLTLSRIDDDPTMVTGDPCDLMSVLRVTLEELMPLAEQRSVSLTADGPGESAWVLADAETLRQILGNLVDNALKYTPSGGCVTVTVIMRPSRLRLEISDTGIGLSSADQERIFERFYRVDRARSRELGGTGLGLSIVKNSVLGLGGKIGVESKLLAGSMFWVELPLA